MYRTSGFCNQNSHIAMIRKCARTLNVQQIHYLIFACFNIMMDREQRLNHFTLVFRHQYILNLNALRILIQLTLRGIMLEIQRLTVSSTSIIACPVVCIAIKVICHQLLASSRLVIEANTSTCQIVEAHNCTV